MGHLKWMCPDLGDDRAAEGIPIGSVGWQVQTRASLLVANPNSRLLADAYAALNRGDVDGFMRPFDPAVVRVEPPGTAGALTLRGVEAIRPFFVAARGAWAEGACEPTRYLAVGDDRVLVYAHVHVRLQGKADWIDGDVFDVFRFEGGRVVDYRTFVEEREALAFAGVA